MRGCRDGGLRAGEMLKRVGAELFGALARRALGIEADVGVEIVEKRGVVFLLKVDNCEQAVDDRLLRGEGASLFSGGQSGFEMAAR